MTSSIGPGAQSRSPRTDRTPNGRYELTTYATRDARRRRNPEGDVEDTAAEYIIGELIRRWRSDAMSGGSVYEEAIPLGKGAAMIVRPAETYEERGSVLFDVYFWTEASGAGGEWQRNSDVYYEPMVSSDDWSLSDLKEALHYAMHHKTLRGFQPVHSKVTGKVLAPEIRFGIMRNPGEDEPTEFEVDADVPAGSGEEPPELPQPELALDRAEGIYEEFHGKPSEELIETEEEVRLRDTLAVLGRLVQIIVESADADRYSITFGDDTMLCVSDDGKQLYAIGGDQSLDLEALGVSGPAAEKDKVFVGSALQVTYRTRKQFDDFAEVDYVHDFGEDGGTLPLLVYDRLNQTVAATPRSCLRSAQSIPEGKGERIPWLVPVVAAGIPGAGSFPSSLPRCAVGATAAGTAGIRPWPSTAAVTAAAAAIRCSAG
jgi:hypothetical protein